MIIENLGSGVTLEMMPIPMGKFLMGSPSNELGRNDNEDPRHQVEIREPFYLGKYLVTQGQWQQIMGNNPSSFKNGDLFPVDFVSWKDCQKFIKKLNAKTKKTYRLPSEAEWEYSCRAGTETPFYFGETLSTEVANYDGYHIYGNGQKGEYRKETTEVGSFPANGFGLYDMHGNLWEWCEDDYVNNYNEPRTQKAYKRTSIIKVLRGGSWNFNPTFCRSADRIGGNAVFSNFVRGFRLALSV
jgi:formylglycine-generating enzyme required for sulfatase activity